MLLKRRNVAALIIINLLGAGVFPDAALISKTAILHKFYIDLCREL